MDFGKDNMASNTGSYQKKTDLLPWNPCQEHWVSMNHGWPPVGKVLEEDHQWIALECQLC